MYSEFLKAFLTVKGHADGSGRVMIHVDFSIYFQSIIKTEDMLLIRYSDNIIDINEQYHVCIKKVLLLKVEG